MKKYNTADVKALILAWHPGTPTSEEVEDMLPAFQEFYDQAGEVAARNPFSSPAFAMATAITFIVGAQSVGAEAPPVEAFTGAMTKIYETVLAITNRLRAEAPAPHRSGLLDMDGKPIVSN